LGLKKNLWVESDWTNAPAAGAILVV